MGRIGGARALLATAAVTSAAGPAMARIVSLDIHRLPDLAFGGRSSGAVDTTDPVDGAIADIGLAPRNAGGLADYAAPVVILRAPDPARGRHEMPFDLDNRGSVPGFSKLDDAAANQNDVGAPGGDGCDAAGLMAPFARTEAERQPKGDPRPSLAARYPSQADYVAKVAAVSEALVADRLLLLDDAIRDVAAARASDVGR